MYRNDRNNPAAVIRRDCTASASHCRPGSAKQTLLKCCFSFWDPACGFGSCHEFCRTVVFLFSPTSSSLSWTTTIASLLYFLLTCFPLYEYHGPNLFLCFGLFACANECLQCLLAPCIDTICFSRFTKLQFRVLEPLLGSLIVQPRWFLGPTLSLDFCPHVLFAFRVLHAKAFTDSLGAFCDQVQLIFGTVLRFWNCLGRSPPFGTLRFRWLPGSFRSRVDGQICACLAHSPQLLICLHLFSEPIVFFQSICVLPASAIALG